MELIFQPSSNCPKPLSQDIESIMTQVALRAERLLAELGEVDPMVDVLREQLRFNHVRAVCCDTEGVLLRRTVYHRERLPSRTGVNGVDLPTFGDVPGDTM